jgi:ribose-phosphate pyrophosphokinase
VNTRKGEGGRILHVLAEDAAPPAPGTQVEATIDWERRYAHMRMHTCLHLLGAVLRYGVTGGQINADKSRLDFDTHDDIDKERVTAAVNALIRANYTVRSQWITEAELDAQPELVRTLSVQPPRGVGRIRLLEIPGVDLQPCGGTHVATTGEIGPVVVTKIENKGRHNKRAGAGRLTAVVPYLAFARKDRRTKARDPVTTRYLACLFESLGVDCVVTLDVHNLAAFQNAFRCRSIHMEAAGLFAAHLAARMRAADPVVMSPDIGGVKRAERFREVLQVLLGRPVGMAFMEKTRSAGVVAGGAVVGEVADKEVVVIDDLIAAGTTMARAARAAAALGARAVHTLATHGLFVGDANTLLADPLLESVIVTDSVPPFRIHAEDVRRKLVVLETAPLVAEVIRRLRGAGPVSELFVA